MASHEFRALSLYYDLILPVAECSVSIIMLVNRVEFECGFLVRTKEAYTPAQLFVMHW